MTMQDHRPRITLLMALFLAFLGLGGCKKKRGDAADAAAGETATATTATTATAAPQAAPASVPEFLDRFCGAVASGDKAYVLAHTNNGAFSSTQKTDPRKCGGRTGKRCSTRAGAAHADADFGPVCVRIKGTPPADLARSVHEEGGALRARLSEGDYLSDLVIERQGADFRLMQEVAPK